ncbi:hypothetical protein [Clavibacter michiganensis]|uniref:hypothetical protein n=1 Tax=Clavibacter michiganensis TaxID=28447 RepID=UPI0011B0ACBE|nr:hypothetical protein [Clavibacter michiganensis]
MSDPVDESIEHLGRQAGRVVQTVTSEIGRQLQRAGDERCREQQDARRRAERAREGAIREVERRAERERERAAQQIAREQEHAARLAARYGRSEAVTEHSDEPKAEAAPVKTQTAAGLEPCETPRDVVREQPVGEPSRSPEVAQDEVRDIGIDGARPATEEASTYDSRELEDREQLRAAGIDPDERSSSPAGDGAMRPWENHPTRSEIRGDEGAER